MAESRRFSALSTNLPRGPDPVLMQYSRIKKKGMSQQIQHINPDGMASNPAYSQGVVTFGNGKTIYVGGQNAVNELGEIVGKGDLAAQTMQAMQNVQAVLEAAGAGWNQVIKLSVFILQGNDPVKGFQAAQSFMARMAKPPAVTVLLVAGLGNPDF